jgi:hypothetical protein
MGDFLTAAAFLAAVFASPVAVAMSFWKPDNPCFLPENAGFVCRIQWMGA